MLFRSCQMRELVTELRIVGSETNIFDTDIEYTIPLYQRAYAWENKQLIQLVEDISDVSDDANYYIGALIVSRQGNKFEVVDGQQRLTSLYLLLNCLGLDVKNSLTFAYRDKSNYTGATTARLGGPVPPAPPVPSTRSLRRALSC